MSPLKSVIIALVVGVIAYVAATNVARVRNSSEIGVTDSLALGAKMVTPSANNFGTNLAQGDKTLALGAKSVAPSAKLMTPSATPLGTALAPVTPRPVPFVSATPASSPVSTLKVTPTPTQSPVVPRTTTPIPSPTPTPSPTDTPSPTVSTTPSLTPTPTTTGTAHVVINEIAWAGTATSSTDEWLELYNWGTAAQELDGWSLCDTGGAIVTFTPSNRLESQTYFLIERGDDRTVSDISADHAHSFGSGGLLNDGENLTLRSGTCAAGAIIDEVGPGKWYGGTSSPGFSSMERISADSAGNVASNWATWGTVPDSQGNVNSTGLDAASNPIRGTPKYRNSVSR